MRYILTIIVSLLPLISAAQSTKLLEIDESSFEPVQTDVLSGVAIDKIGLDPSRRPCARIKMHINRMTEDEIEGVSVRPIGGSVVVTKRIVSADGNGLIIELTAKEATRFYLHHDKYGDSNEVCLNLEGNKEYRINAMLNTTHSIVISCNKPEAEVYLDGIYKGQISDTYDLTIGDVYPGPHSIRVKFGSASQEESVEVSSSNIHFRIILDLESAKPQFVAFRISPADASLIIDGKPYMLNKYGEIAETLMLNNGTYTYTVSAKDYHDEMGTFTVSGAKVDKQVDLKPAYGFLKVSGEGVLNGAGVYVDDKYIGDAPVTSGRIPSGEHTVRIVKPLFKETVTRVVIYDGKTRELNPTLVADFAKVTLTSKAGSDIYVNGDMKGKSPWTGNLRSGVYNFEARMAGHRNSTVSKTISAVPSAQTYSIPDPTPILGRVDLISSPMSDVYVDGTNVGRTPLSTNLLVGQHTVSFKKEGFRTEVRTIDIKEEQPAMVKVTLEEVIVAEPTGKINDVTIEHNVMKDGVKGMKILVDFEVQNMKGSDVFCSIYFYHKDGSKLLDSNKSYWSADGQVSVGENIKPGYDNTTYNDFELFIPNSEIEVGSGKHELKFFCELFQKSSTSWESVTSSDWQNFTIENNSTYSGAITGKIKDVTVEHNVMKDGVKGMKILVDFEVQNMKGIRGRCSAYFYYENGNKVLDTNGEYKTTDGQVSSGKDFKPNYDNSVFTDLEIFIPNNEIEVGTGKHDVKFHCCLWEYSGAANEIAESDWYHFTITK